MHELTIAYLVVLAALSLALLLDFIHVGTALVPGWLVLIVCLVCFWIALYPSPNR